MARYISQRLRKLFSDSALLGLATLVASSISALFILPIVVKNLTPTEYGYVSIIIVSASILSRFLSIGSEASISMNYHDDRSFGNNQRLMGNILSIIFLSSLIIISLVTVSMVFIEITIPELEIIVMVILIAIFSSIEIASNTLLKVQAQNKLISKINALKQVLLLIVIVIVVIFANLNIQTRIGADIIIGLVTVSYYLYIIKGDFNLHFDLDLTTRLIKFSSPMVLHSICIISLYGFDRYLIEYYEDLESVGAYSLGYTIAAFVSIACMAIDGAWTSYFYEQGKELGSEESSLELAMTFGVISCIISLLTCTLVSIQPIFFWLFSIEGSYLDAMAIIPAVSLGLVFNGMYMLFSKPMVLKKCTFTLSMITLSCASLNIILNLILIPKYSIEGAAFATLCSYFLLMILSSYFSQKQIFINYSWPKIIYPIFLTTIFCILQFFRNQSESWVVLLQMTIILFLLVNLKTSTMDFLSLEETNYQNQ